MDFTLGERYTRRDIHTTVGGSMQSYLPTVNGRVVAGCFDRRLNPAAPSVLLVGTGPMIEGSAEAFVRQASAVPIFIKLATNEWEYVGMYRAVRVTRNRTEIEQHNRQIRRDDVAAVLFLTPEGSAP